MVKLEKGGIAKWFILAALMAVLSAFVIPRIPVAGFMLAIVLVVAGVFVSRMRIAKGLPIGGALILLGAMAIVGNVFGSLKSSTLNISSPQAITQRQRADPVASAFL